MTFSTEIDALLNGSPINDNRSNANNPISPTTLVITKNTPVVQVLAQKVSPFEGIVGGEAEMMASKWTRQDFPWSRDIKKAMSQYISTCM